MRRVVLALALFSGALLLFTLILDGSQTPFDARLGMVGPTGLALTVLLAAWHRKRIPQAAPALLLMLMLLELGNVTTYGYQAKGQGKSLLNELSQHNDIAAFLRAQPEPARVEINESEVAYNFGDWHGIEHFGGYLASMTNNVSRMQGSLVARALYGVKYFVGRAPIRPDQVEVFTSASGLKVYRNPRAMPRAWVVHSARSVERDDRILPVVESADFHASQETALKGQTPELETCGENETVALTHIEPSRLGLTANLHCRGMVIIADTYFPGWVATVDGRPATIHEAYGCLQSVVVDRGEHRIELTYRPRSVYWGASLTAIGLLGAIAAQLSKT